MYDIIPSFQIQSTVNREDYIRSELDQVWKTSSLDPVARCREIFIRVAVEIITRKWRDTALANEIQRLNKASAAKVSFCMRVGS